MIPLDVSQNPHDAEAIIQAFNREPWPVDGAPHILATHNGVIDLTPYLPPLTQASVRVAHTSDAFVALTNHVQKDGSVVFSDAKRGMFETVVDFGTADTPTRDEHRVEFTPEKDPVWLAWAALHNSPIDQNAFADFIEERIDSIIAPAGADLLELVQDIKGHKNVSFRSAQRLDNGETKILYDETVAASSGRTGKGEITIPNMITVQTPIFRYESADTFDAFLRYRITATGELIFTVKIRRADDLVPEAFADIAAGIDHNVTIPVIAGWHR